MAIHSNYLPTYVLTEVASTMFFKSPVQLIMMKLKASFFAFLVGCVLAIPSGLAQPADGQGDWQPFTVPGATNYAGNAWYRAWVQVPDSFFAQHERNLFEESVGVNI